MTVSCTPPISYHCPTLHLLPLPHPPPPPTTPPSTSSHYPTLHLLPLPHPPPPPTTPPSTSSHNPTLLLCRILHTCRQLQKGHAATEDGGFWKVTCLSHDSHMTLSAAANCQTRKGTEEPVGHICGDCPRTEIGFQVANSEFGIHSLYPLCFATVQVSAALILPCLESLPSPQDLDGGVEHGGQVSPWCQGRHLPLPPQVLSTLSRPDGYIGRRAVQLLWG